MINRNKIGVVVTTFNSENYFETLFNSLPDDRYGPLVVVNGGEPYKNLYKRMNGEVHWIQHETNFGPTRSRNDGLKMLYDLGCEYLFLMDDDLIIKSEDIFDAYINTSEVTGLQYFCFTSYAQETGVVVTTYNSERHLETCFNSLSSDRYGPLVVVNKENL
jgi:glycosyltransferase involved in cell wall biosynthesis